MISVVIPVFNEAAVIANTLSYVLSMEGDYEVIVVDGGSTDDTCEIVKQYDDVAIVESAKGRAVQMNCGAAYATGEFILFLHADTFLPANALKKINAYEVDENVGAGGFRHQFSGDDWRLNVISWIDNYRCRRSRIFYGDQAVFVRRDLFDQLGGFPDQDVLEDWVFGKKLRILTKPIFIKESVITDARKFQKQGVWKSFFRVSMILTRLKFGMSVSKQHPFFQDIR